jgi:hypothetical protein
MASGALMGNLRVTRKGNATTIQFDGPFFTKNPFTTLDVNIDTMLKAMAEEGVQDVRAQVRAHKGDMPYSTGWSAQRVSVRRHIPWGDGRRWAMIWTSTQGMAGRPKLPMRSAVTAGGNKVGTFKGNVAARTLAAMSTIEGRWHPFRITKNRLRKSRAVNVAELTKGL